MATQLCATIDRMLAGSLRAAQTFPVSTVTQSVLAVPNYRTKARSARQLVLKAVEDSRHFALDDDDGVLTVTAGKERLQELREHIRGIMHGEVTSQWIPTRRSAAVPMRLFGLVDVPATHMNARVRGSRRPPVKAGPQ
jgi:hypothetical protein